MTRIRTIKPEFFRHEGLFDLERESGLPIRLAYIGLWTVADRDGRFKWRPRALKPDVLPYDDVDIEQVLLALESGGFIGRYESDGEQFAFIPSWHEHQKPNIREAQSTIPSPDQPGTCMHVYTLAESAKLNGINIPKALRETVFGRDGRRCLRCGSTEDLTVDHILPRSAGGTHILTNLRTLCRKCNSARPVSGSALLKDLESDGFTIEGLKRTCMHVQARGELELELEREGELEDGAPAVADAALPVPVKAKKAQERDPLRDALAESFRAKTPQFSSPAKENTNLLRLASAIRRKAETDKLSPEDTARRCVEHFWSLNQTGKEFYRPFTPSKMLATLDALYESAREAARAEDISWLTA